MKTSIRILSLAVLALAMAACSNDMEQPAAIQPAPGNAGEGIPFSATISTGSATTRALKEEKGIISSTWAKDEQVALIHNGVVDVMTAGEPDENGNVTITGTLSVTPEDNDDVIVVYPASAVDKDEKAVKPSLLTTQDGTLTNIATSLNLRQSDGAKLKVGKTATLNGTVTLANQIAIVKFSLSDGPNALAAKQFVIKDGSDNVLTTVTPSKPASNLYVAMAPATNAAAFKFEATVGDFTYTYEKSGVTLEASTYYQSPITMTISKKAGEISFATTSISKTFGDEPFINEPTITGDGTVTYSSSDTKVAEVNATTGEVTIKGDGEAIITATVEQQLSDGSSVVIPDTMVAGKYTIELIAMWHGEFYYPENVITVTKTFELTINKTDKVEISDTVNVGEKYDKNGFDVTPTEAGTTDHTLTLTNANGCDSVVVLHLTAIIPEGIHDFDIVRSIYPNPTTNYVTIQVSGQAMGSELRIYDMQGRLMKAQIIDNETVRIDLTSFANGVYLLKADSQTVKIIKH